MKPFWVFITNATKQLNVQIFLALLVLVLCFLGSRIRTATLLALAAWPLADIFSNSLKRLIPFERPCVALPDVHLRIHKLTTFGTASSHAANMAAITCVFWYFLGWRGGLAWLFVALLSGLSRIYVGVHFPSQVLLGYLCGSLCGFIVARTWATYASRRSQRQAAQIESDSRPVSPQQAAP